MMMMMMGMTTVMMVMMESMLMWERGLLTVDHKTLPNDILEEWWCWKHLRLSKKTLAWKHVGACAAKSVHLEQLDSGLFQVQNTIHTGDGPNRHQGFHSSRTTWFQPAPMLRPRTRITHKGLKRLNISMYSWFDIYDVHGQIFAKYETEYLIWMWKNKQHTKIHKTTIIFVSLFSCLVGFARKTSF